MKYLPLPEFEDVTSALNFDTADCHVVGGCDLYTTKAAGSDKKLYKNIEHSLESQYESLLRLSASLSTPQAESIAPSLNLSRSSPFGPLSQISSRRTFAYLIATLNASHPDYDFSHILRPTDFRRERSLRGVMNTIDTTLHNLRPRTASALFSVPATWSSSSSKVPHTPGGSSAWGPRMWTIIDNQMTLRECSIHCYSPEEDPFDGEEGAIWSLNYFFFNKHRKRVCYLYLRGLSQMNHSPVRTPLVTPVKRKGAVASPDDGARKRAKYWLGDQEVDEVGEEGLGEDEDQDQDFIRHPGDNEVDATSGAHWMEGMTDGFTDAEDVDTREMHNGAVRALSEGVVERMDV